MQFASLFSASELGQIGDVKTPHGRARNSSQRKEDGGVGNVWFFRSLAVLTNVNIYPKTPRLRKGQNGSNVRHSALK
jgi:hypothetical protein